MCIVSLSIKEQDFILTHNRDEDVNRASSKVLHEDSSGHEKVIYPQDEFSKGTWILSSNTWATCMLNGAETCYKHNPPYRHSRGKIPFILQKYKEFDKYYNDLMLDNIAPFTQIVVHIPSTQAYLLQWDGNKKSFIKIKESFSVFSSSTLYNKEAKNKNKLFLSEFKDDLNAEELLKAHKKLKWKFCSQLPKIQTTSITQISYIDFKLIMEYDSFSNVV